MNRIRSLQVPPQAIAEQGANAPDPEVSEAVRRRRFSANYKLRVLREAEACSSTQGELGALLRREGLYSSHLTSWRRQRERGELDALQPRRRGRPPTDPANAVLFGLIPVDYDEAKHPTHNYVIGFPRTWTLFRDENSPWTVLGPDAEAVFIVYSYPRLDAALKEFHADYTEQSLLDYTSQAADALEGATFGNPEAAFRSGLITLRTTVISDCSVGTATSVISSRNYFSLITLLHMCPLIPEAANELNIIENSVFWSISFGLERR